MITIDGTAYDVPVKGVKRNADFLYKYAERVQSGLLKAELIGVYFNYELEFGEITNTTTYSNLYDKLTEPVVFHTVVVWDEDGSYTFSAYFANVSDAIKRLNGSGAPYWKDLRVSFIAKQPARTPA